MQLSIFPAQEALNTLFDSWLSLQNRCNNGADNSNSYLRLADQLRDNPDSELQVLCVHDGEPSRELHAVCVVETHRGWIASKRTLANWISTPGLDSTPLSAEQQRFSALHTLLKTLPSIDSSPFLLLRHIPADSETTQALQAICTQLHRQPQVNCERGGSLCELKIPMKSNASQPNELHESQQFESLRSLP